MVNNVEICQELGYINVPKHMIRKLDKTADEMPDQKVVILCTGAQGEEFSALARMSRGEHPQITLRKGDTILLSSSTIPGNELAMASMKNNLVSKDIKLITNDSMDIHTSGHGGAEDHKLMLTLLKPQFFLPFFLDATARYAHRDLAINMGFDPSRILMPNETGSVIEIFDNGVRVAEKKLPLRTVLVDGK
jgi:ribonuclease J